jgi:hypothetical protein
MLWTTHGRREICWKDLADDEPIEQMADGSKPLLSR